MLGHCRSFDAREQLRAKSNSLRRQANSTICRSRLASHWLPADGGHIQIVLQTKLLLRHTLLLFGSSYAQFAQNVASNIYAGRDLFLFAEKQNRCFANTQHLRLNIRHILLP